MFSVPSIKRDDEFHGSFLSVPRSERLVDSTPPALTASIFVRIEQGDPPPRPAIPKRSPPVLLLQHPRVVHECTLPVHWVGAIVGGACPVRYRVNREKADCICHSKRHPDLHAPSQGTRARPLKSGVFLCFVYVERRCIREDCAVLEKQSVRKGMAMAFT